jgi:hypothetical protein
MRRSKSAESTVSMQRPNDGVLPLRRERVKDESAVVNYYGVTLDIHRWHGS